MDALGRAASSLVVQYGGPVSNALLDPRYEAYRTAEVEGVVPYRDSWRCNVAVGDPVCAAPAMPRLAARFRDHCASRGRSTVFAACSERIAEAVCGWGGAAVEFGETLIFDPHLDPQSGRRGREVRKKVRRASREGAVLHEYRPEQTGREPALERALEEVVAAWLGARKGPQVYISRVHLFEPDVGGRRWFYGLAGGRVVGVLALLPLAARGGYLLEHLLAAPASPVGTTELLVTECFAVLAAEGCRFATFGPVPAQRLGSARNFGHLSESFARILFAEASRRFLLGGRAHFQRKFQVAHVEPAFVAFDPPRVDLCSALGLVRAFNVSLG
jgi:lysylphosphatidylglycerol synthetase-like protein (DUF2156 family)